MHFASKDFSAVSLKGIAADVGISDAAIYNHFQSKDDLFSQTICTVIDRYIALYEQAVCAEMTWKAQMNAILAAIEEDVGGASRLPRIAAVAESVASRDRNKFAPIYQRLARLKSIFVEVATNGKQSGHFPNDADIDALASVLMSMVTSGVSASMIGDRSEKNLIKVLQSYRTLLDLNEK